MPAPKNGTHWLDAERLRVYPRLFLLAYVVLGIGWVALAQSGVDRGGKPLGYDFIAFWSASKLALDDDPVAAYDLGRIVETQRETVPGILTQHPWHYPPTFLLVVLPFALLPYALSYWVFVGASLVAYVQTVRRVLPISGGLMLVLAFPGTLLNLFHGQNAFLTTALMGAALLNLQARPWIAGLCLGLLTIKPHLGVLIPIALICGGYWRVLLSATIFTVAFLAFSLLVLGSETLSAFFGRLPQVSSWVIHNQLPQVKMPTLFAETLRLGGPPTLAFGMQAAAALFALGGVIWLWRSTADHALKFAGLCTGSLMVSPYLFDYDLAWLALPIAWFAGYGLREGWRPGERNLLAMLWLAPLLVAPVALAIRFEPAPLLIVVFFMIILRRAWRDTRAGGGGTLSGVSGSGLT